MDTNTEFEAFFANRCAVAEAFSNGEPTSYLALVATDSVVTFHSPEGQSFIGADSVRTTFAKHAASFQRGGESHFEVFQKDANDDLGFWTGLQIARVKIAGQEKPQEMRIRVTEVFRRLDGAWKLIHRHADLAAPRTVEG